MIQHQNKYIAKYITNKFFDKRVYENANLKFSLELQSTWNYYYLIFILVIAYIIKLDSNNVLFSSSTIVFLLDTYISNHKKMIEKYNNEEKIN